MGLVHYEDYVAIGEKIVNMADRARVMNSVVPSACANWSFEMDGVTYAVTVRATTPSSPDNARG